MSTPSDELLGLIDREKIRECIARVARGEDRRDAQLISASFWPDARTDYGVFVGSFSEYLAWVVPGSPAIPVTLHTLGQSLIDCRGNEAAVETHVAAYHRIEMGGQARDRVIGGRYLDRMQKRGAEWRIASRTMLYDWTNDFGQSADWSQGLLGMPFLTQHSVGAAHGDHSEVFFKAD